MHHIRKFVMPKKQVRIEDSNPRFKQLCLHSRRYVAIDRPENVLSEKWSWPRYIMKKHTHSFATGPDIAEPFISPLGLTITPALSYADWSSIDLMSIWQLTSNRTLVPSFRRQDFRWRRTTTGMAINVVSVRLNTCGIQVAGSQPQILVYITHFSSSTQAFLSSLMQQPFRQH